MLEQLRKHSLQSGGFFGSQAELLYSVPGITRAGYLSRVIPNPHTGSTYCWIEQSAPVGIFMVGCAKWSKFSDPIC